MNCAVCGSNFPDAWQMDQHVSALHSNLWEYIQKRGAPFLTAPAPDYTGQLYHLTEAVEAVGKYLHVVQGYLQMLIESQVLVVPDAFAKDLAEFRRGLGQDSEVPF